LPSPVRLALRTLLQLATQAREPRGVIARRHSRTATPSAYPPRPITQLMPPTPSSHVSAAHNNSGPARRGKRRGRLRARASRLPSAPRGGGCRWPREPAAHARERPG
jgi:hypothetical protein